MKYTTTITITIDEKHISFGISLILQCLFLLAIALVTQLDFNIDKSLPKSSKSKELTIETMNVTKKPTRFKVVRRASQGQNRNRYDINEGTSLDSLLGNLAQKTKTKKSINKKVVNTIAQEGKDLKNMINKKSMKEASLVSGVSTFDKFSFTDVDKKKVKQESKQKSVDVEAINMALADSNSDFQNCYERALLVDTEMSGKAEFFINVVSSKVKSTKVDFRGKGSPKAVSTLKGCLESASKGMDFGVQKVTRGLKFSLLFKS